MDISDQFSHFTLPPGPDACFKVRPDEPTFARLPEWLDTYGDVVCIWPEPDSPPSILVNNPEYVRHLLVRNHRNYIKGPGFERVKMLLGNGIIVSDGDFWRRQRRMIQPAFGQQSLRRLFEHVRQCNEQAVAELQAHCDSGKPLDLTHWSNRLSLDVILRVMFSEDLKRLEDWHGSDPFEFLTRDLTRDIKVVLMFRELMGLFERLVDWRREHRPERSDFLEFFMTATDKDGQGMSKKELIDELMTAIIAGHETSAITLNWSWYFISQHPKVESEALEEIAAVCKGQVPGYDNLAELEIIRKLVHEALRIYPPVWIFSRTALEQDRIGPWDIPPGSDIFITPYFMHRKTDYWPDSESFDPGRFDAERIKQIPPQAFIPFSSGPRRCIGDNFAILETQLHFGMMLPQFRMQTARTNSVELEPLINLRVKHPMQAQVRYRD